MSKTTKVVLIVLAAVFILGILGLVTCVGLSVLWFKANEDDLRNAGHQAIVDGEAYGTTHDLDECVDETLDRLDDCGPFNMICEGTIGVFMTSCLESSEFQPGFCEGVPSDHDIFGSVQWSLDICAEKGRPNSQPCTRAVQNIQRYCRNARPTKALVPQQPSRPSESHESESRSPSETGPSHIMN